jgi:2-hydroxy-3-keto-5-methylthiopentenyl-1-phosphate phosphatase
MDLLYQTFAASSCWDLVQGWIRGEVTTPQEIQGCFSTMKASREEMEAVLDTVQIDPAFPKLVEYCGHREYPLAILSDGLRWYIEYVLKHHGINDLPIFANEIDFLPDGYRIITPWYHPQTLIAVYPSPE